MAERKKVIEALKNCTTPPKCQDCPWEECEDFAHSSSAYPDGLIKAALELLKAQEPIEPDLGIIGSAMFWKCGGCGGYIFSNADQYCSRCGKPIKWKQDNEQRQAKPREGAEHDA